MEFDKGILDAPGCQRIKEFYEVGPAQRAAVESLVKAVDTMSRLPTIPEIEVTFSIGDTEQLPVDLQPEWCGTIDGKGNTKVHVHLGEGNLLSEDVLKSHLPTIQLKGEDELKRMVWFNQKRRD
jgi:hypothetical protein